MESVTKADAEGVAALIANAIKNGQVRDEDSFDALRELRAKLFRLATASEKLEEEKK